MEPLESLRNEHGLMRHFMDNMELAARMLEEDKRPPTEFFAKAVEFVRTFADGLHHHKEEHVMFTQLAQKHGGEMDAEIAALRSQHEVARNNMAEIASYLAGYDEGQPVPASKILENTKAYCELMRKHVHQEDHVFFPKVKETMSAEEMDMLDVEFKRAADKAGEGFFEESHMLVVDMGSMLAHM